MLMMVTEGELMMASDYRNKPYEVRTVLDERQQQLLNQRRELMIKKGVHPYEYMGSCEKFDESQLPPKHKFFQASCSKNYQYGARAAYRL